MRKTLMRIGPAVGTAVLALGLSATTASAAPAVSEHVDSTHQTSEQATAAAGWVYLGSYGTRAQCDYQKQFWPPQWYPSCFWSGSGYDLYIYA
jgi:hypothetical protein